MKVRSCCDSCVSDCSNYLTLGDYIAFFYAGCAKMCIPCVNSVLVLDYYIETKTVIVGNCNNLAVCSCNNRISLSPSTKIKPFVNVPLLRDWVDVLAKLHGNMSDSIFYRPDIRNIRKKCALVFKHFSNLFNWTNCAFQISRKLFYVGSFL